MAEVKSADSHNLVILLANPSVAQGEFKSMMHGLRECFLNTALTVNPTIYQGILKEFWRSADL